MQRSASDRPASTTQANFMVVAAGGFAVLLSKKLRSDVAVGFPSPAAAILRWITVGFLSTPLGVARVSVGDPASAELLGQVRARSLAAYENQDVPFEVPVDHASNPLEPDPSPR